MKNYFTIIFDSTFLDHSGASAILSLTEQESLLSSKKTLIAIKIGVKGTD